MYLLFLTLYSTWVITLKNVLRKSVLTDFGIDMFFHQLHLGKYLGWHSNFWSPSLFLYRMMVLVVTIFKIFTNSRARVWEDCTLKDKKEQGKMSFLSYNSLTGDIRMSGFYLKISETRFSVEFCVLFYTFKVKVA